MKKIFTACFISAYTVLSLYGQLPATVKPVKNIIVMIPDGTSLDVISAARWYKMYNRQGNSLNIDPYLCGTVSTFCSNSPIGDSAPTTSCYMTGVPQRAGNVSIYPLSDQNNDIIPLDTAKAYQPLATLLEAARIHQQKSIGLVVTCEFPHATPADCSSHLDDRSNYSAIARQMAYNSLDIMFGGGNDLITDDIRSHFKSTGTTLIQDNLKEFLNFNDSGKLWALFDKMSMPYDMDRDPEKMPSLEQMTTKAIERLSRNENGFFLVVEGSKVDWAAHDNDAAACITEFIAFDNAVGAALKFAHSNSETAVIILPDHGNSGFTIGNASCGSPSSSLSDLFGTVSQYKKSAPYIESVLEKTQPENIKSVFAHYTGLDITDSELQTVLQSSNYKMGVHAQQNSGKSLNSNIIKIMNAHTCFGFTTTGHTGEEVFLAAYHPSGHRPAGFVTNIQMNEYLHKASGLDIALSDLSATLFAKHTDLLAGLKYEISNEGAFPVLTVTKGRNKLVVSAFSSVAQLNGNPIILNSVTVYIDKNNTFYLPHDILKKAGL